MKRTTPLLSLLLILTACSPPAPTPYPSPQPTQEPPTPTLAATPTADAYPVPAVETPTITPLPAPPGYRPPSTDTSFLPLVTSRPCNDSPKRAIALAYWERGWPHDLLCMPAASTLYHTWGIVGGKTELGNKLSVIWTSKKNQYDYLSAWTAWVEKWEDDNGRPYTGFVLWANEPDRPDQANLTTEETAQLFLDAVEVCPTCRFIGPMYSAADAGQMVREVWDIVLEICGNPCPAMDSLYAHSLHVYPRPLLNYGPSGRVDDFCRIVDGGDCERPIWITEFGYRNCYGGTRKVFSHWIREAEADPRIEYYFVYSTYQRPQTDCHFTGLLQWESWEAGPVLDEMGLAWRGVATE